MMLIEIFGDELWNYTQLVVSPRMTNEQLIECFDDQWNRLKGIELVMMLNVTSMDVLCLNGRRIRELIEEKIEHCDC